MLTIGTRWLAAGSLAQVAGAVAGGDVQVRWKDADHVEVEWRLVLERATPGPG